MSIEAMKQWREALECALSDDKPYIDRCKQAITSIDQAIAEAEKQEPVAWGVHDQLALNKMLAEHPPKRNVATPREWVELTPEERKQLWDEWENGHVVEATEAKLKEKNT